MKQQKVYIILHNSFINAKLIITFVKYCLIGYFMNVLHAVIMLWSQSISCKSWNVLFLLQPTMTNLYLLKNYMSYLHSIYILCCGMPVKSAPVITRYNSEITEFCNRNQNEQSPPVWRLLHWGTALPMTDTKC